MEDIGTDGSDLSGALVPIAHTFAAETHVYDARARRSSAEFTTSQARLDALPWTPRDLMLTYDYIGPG